MAGSAPALVSAVRAPRNPISRRQVERVISRSVAVFGVVFGAQTVPRLLQQANEANLAWVWTVTLGLFGTLVIVLVHSFARFCNVDTSTHNGDTSGRLVAQGLHSGAALPFRCRAWAVRMASRTVSSALS